MDTRFWSRFRESRLYTQIILSVALVALAGAVLVLPWTGASRLRQAVVWSASRDYDFAGRGAAVAVWAKQHGGWKNAGADLWVIGVNRVAKWAPVPFLPAGGSKR